MEPVTHNLPRTLPTVPLPLLEPMLATNRELTEGHRWAIEPKLDGERSR